MHHCFRLSEILEVIFQFVFDSVEVEPDRHYVLPGLLPSPCAQDRRSVLHLALTCRAFYDPALNVLYSHLRDIYHLIKSLPDQLVELILSRRPFPAEHFRSLVLCAARVQILCAAHIQLLFDPCYNDTAYTFLLASVPKDAPLFPKLRSLAWHDERLASIQVLTFLLPTVETPSISISDIRFRKTIIPGLRTAAPRLKALEFEGITPWDYPSEIESLLLSYPEILAELSFLCCDISSSLLRAIALWPRLRWLSVQLGFKSIPTAPLHVSQSFQALAHLHISCQDLNIFISFLCAFRMLGMDSDTFGCPNLNTIHINTNRCSPASSWSELLTVLTRTKLEHIIISERCHDHAQPCPAPSSFDFYPLLAHPTALADLKTLVLSPGHSSSIALTGADIITLARAWSCLNILDLGLRNTPVSLYALGILVRRCRELREVSLCVNVGLDALGATPLNDDDNQLGSQPNMRLIKLDVGESPIACAGPLHPLTAPDLMRSIPRFLHAMAPRLEGISRTACIVWFQGIYGRRWETVSDALFAMANEVEHGD
ncbi:uncharacterized protein EDB91DRAFT_1241700 [Suillus paluster]|uniref:uncharacterized protein n=1 Tax=Suillus paluster TaxID=48578 RepID=UPI001B87398F|nr:uncharacterized protein EDB91DRAFT_1241700 [Suillus paluster]KAG1756655.1 hypothetical protein EDB91DRAFT_1241700 [Suillus paluster]